MSHSPEFNIKGKKIQSLVVKGKLDETRFGQNSDEVMIVGTSCKLHPDWWAAGGVQLRGGNSSFNSLTF